MSGKLGPSIIKSVGTSSKRLKPFLKQLSALAGNPGPTFSQRIRAIAQVMAQPKAMMGPINMSESLFYIISETQEENRKLVQKREVG
jgi:hypothetical protein